MSSGVYEIANLVNGHRYIGSAVNLYKRWQNHQGDLRNNIHGNKHLQHAWNKYGQDAFQFRVLVLCAREHLVLFEQRAMDHLAPEYNICPMAYSQLGMVRSDEVCDKISRALSGRKRKPFSDETRARMSASKMGNIYTRGHKNALGHKHTPETRAKISAAVRVYNQHHGMPEAS